MFGRRTVNCFLWLCAVLAASKSFGPFRSRWSPWGRCSVTCGQTPGVQSRHKEWGCRTGVNGWCRTANSEHTRRCYSNTPCVTPKPAACHCTPPHNREPCCPRGEATHAHMFFRIKNDSITRGHSLALVKSHSRLDIRKYTFSQRVVNDWNKLPEECINATSVNMFKNKIDQ